MNDSVSVPVIICSLSLSSLTIWFSFLCVAMKRHSLTKGNLREERIYLACASRSRSVIEESQSRNSSRNLKVGLLNISCSIISLTAREAWQKPWRNAAGWLIHRRIASFLIQPRTTCLGLVLPAVGWALPHQLASKIISHRHVHKPLWSRWFLNWDSL